MEPTLIEVPIDEWEGIGIGHLGETEGVDIVPDDIVSADIPNSCETNGDLEHIDPSPGPTEKKRENWLTDPFSVLKIDDGYIYREGFLEWFDVDKWIPTPEPDPEVVLEPDTIITFNPGNDVPIDKITVSKIKIENELQQIIDSGKSINAIGAKGMNQLMVNGIKQAIKERQTKIVMK